MTRDMITESDIDKAIKELNDRISHATRKHGIKIPTSLPEIKNIVTEEYLEFIHGKSTAEMRYESIDLAVASILAFIYFNKE